MTHGKSAFSLYLNQDLPYKSLFSKVLWIYHSEKFASACEPFPHLIDNVGLQGVKAIFLVCLLVCRTAE